MFYLIAACASGLFICLRLVGHLATEQPSVMVTMAPAEESVQAPQPLQWPLETELIPSLDLDLDLNDLI